MSYNLADLPKDDDMDKVKVDFAASGVAYKERMNMPVIPAEVASKQPEHLLE
ncbi:DNA polymerase III subunit theta [Serratia fonticola]|nr:DNA polymerase III subunit theta [Serratia fonticola]